MRRARRPVRVRPAGARGRAALRLVSALRPAPALRLASALRLAPAFRPASALRLAPALASALALGACGGPPAASTEGEPPVAGGRPGDLVRTTAAPVDRVGGVAVAGRRILYRSRDARDRPTVVSGLVLVPRARWSGAGPRPVVGWAPGTVGMADRCAASRAVLDGSSPELDGLASALRRGFAVALTDYQGIGTPGEHPYAVGRALGRNQLDAVRAATRLPGAPVPAGGPVGLIGYSEGGGATAWAAQLTARHAPELDVRGASPGGVLGDPLVSARALDGSGAATFLFYAVIGFDVAYPELRLRDALSAPAREGLVRLTDSCVADGGPVATGLTVRGVTGQDLLARPAWAARLRENTAGLDGAPRAPVLLVHVRRDEVLPYRQAVLTRDRWCARGADARLVATPGADHAAGAAPAAEIGLDFLAARFAGRPSARGAGCTATSG